jgi:hypothetical protein
VEVIDILFYIFSEMSGHLLESVRQAELPCRYVTLSLQEAGFHKLVQKELGSVIKLHVE